MRQDMIVILDLGSEENPRLAREIRALGVYSEIHPHDITLEELKALPNVKGIILNGGANRIVDGVEIDAAKEIYNYEVPVLLADHKGDAPWPDDREMRREALSNFVFGLCGAQPNWNMENFIADQVELIRRQVGERKVLLALSGGVDSSVVAALLIKAIGKQLTCVHVNHGLLRKGEPEQVVRVFRDEMDANLIYVDAVDRFLDKLAGVADPENKRKIIGAEFIRVFEEEARKLEGIEFLAQGTIYPDIIESGTKTVKAVKAHHNVGGLPEDLQFELVEPLKLLFKDEVRAWARPWACRTAWSTASRSRAPDWVCAAWAPSPVTVWKPSGSPMPFFGRSLPRTVWGARCGSTLPSSPTSSLWASATTSAPTSGALSSVPSTPWTP